MLARAHKLAIFMIKTMPLEQIRPQGHPETCQSSQTVHFDCQKQWLGTDFELKVAQTLARAPKPPISSSKRCPGIHRESKVAQKLARVLKPSIFIVKRCPGNGFEPQNLPKHKYIFSSMNLHHELLGFSSMNLHHELLGYLFSWSNSRAALLGYLFSSMNLGHAL